MNRDLAVSYFVVYLCLYCLYLFEVEGVEKAILVLLVKVGSMCTSVKVFLGSDMMVNRCIMLRHQNVVGLTVFEKCFRSFSMCHTPRMLVSCSWRCLYISKVCVETENMNNNEHVKKAINI